MACYPCTHCNKCGMYSARAEIVCDACEEPIPVGVSSCPTCGGKKFRPVRLPDASLRANMRNSPQREKDSTR